MREVITEAIILDKEDLGEQDSRIFLFTKDLGKLVAKATSARKITSKLAAHLEPLSYIEARLVSRGDAGDGRGFQVADALEIDSKPGLDAEQLSEVIRTLEVVRASVPENVPDEELWNFLQIVRQGKTELGTGPALKKLGFDFTFAWCELCKSAKPEYFFPRSNWFVCQTCRLNSKEEKREFIKIKRP